MAKKVCLVIAYAQSVEKGPGTSPNKVNGVAVAPTVPGPNVRYTSIFGQPDVSLTSTSSPPGYIDTSSRFNLLREGIARETGWTVSLINRAVGNTGAVDSWVGWNGSRIYNQGEAGYDPSSFIDKAVGSVQLAVSQGYEVWMYTAGHQNDIAANRPVDQIIAASVHIQNRCKAAGASKVIVGRTMRYIGGSYEAEFNPGGKIHQIADGVLAAIPGSIAGADLSVNLDTNLCVKDITPYIHPNHAGICWGAELEMNALKAAKLF